MSGWCLSKDLMNSDCGAAESFAANHVILDSTTEPTACVDTAGKGKYGLSALGFAEWNGLQETQKILKGEE